MAVVLQEHLVLVVAEAVEQAVYQPMGLLQHLVVATRAAEAVALIIPLVMVVQVDLA